MKMKSEEIKSVSNDMAAVGAESLPQNGTTVSSTTMPVETAVEATENPKRKSWMKNLGSGMRTLRLRKHGGSDKKNETALNNLADPATADPGECETSATNFSSTAADNSSQQSLPPQIPLPPLPTDTTPSTSTSVPPSPSSKTLSKSKKNKSADSSLSSTKSHTSRLSLREHMSKSKAKKAEAAAAAAAAGLNGSVPREGSASHKSSNGPTNGAAENLDKADPGRFIGDGLSFKAKLIGILEVSGPRGDRICQEALSELKMAVKAAGEHKQKVTVHVALDGLRIRDEKTGDCLYHHQVHKISFIAQDLTDTRAFGYIFGSPDTGHRFFGIKTEKSASQVVMSMRDLFQVVFDIKKKEIEKAKQQLEMQQKFLATRAAETANRSSHKSGIAETYIDGACSIGGSPIISAAAAPAETDLLNLEVELTSLQEGLDNIHSTLIDTATSHSSFNRGSTASIASDPMNPAPTSFNKYNFNNSGFTSTALDSGGSAVNQLMRGNISAPPGPDPFGDSFDPFDSTKTTGPQNVISPSTFPVDPFAHVDPFAGTKFAGGLESTEYLTSDPFAFETPVGACSFTFPDTGGGRINRQISITSNSSDMSSGKASIDIGRPSMNSTQLTAHSPNLNKAESYNLGVSSWTAAFDDNFASTSGDESKNASSGLGDLFTELDPLGTGRVKPFVDRKDFFQDLKNPPKKVLSELSQSSGVITTSTTQPQENTLKPSQPEPSSSPLPNSFSTNFNPTNLNDLETSTKIPPPSKVDAHLRTSSIRAQLPGSDTPPNYSPPPLPHNPAPITTSSTTSDTPSVYFVRAPPKNTSAKKSPQLLRNMTIASSTHVVPITGQTPSPKTLPRSSMRLDRMESLPTCGTDEIPNITPPPRPPHTLLNPLGGTIKVDRAFTLSTTALPRPHSGEGKRNLNTVVSSQPPVIGGATVPPEPPPRPFVPSIEPVLPPPPLPPKKQTIGPIMSTTLGRVNYDKSLKTRSTGDAICNFNDLPLPLPLRKGSQQNGSSRGQQQPRYAYPVEDSPSASLGGGFGSNRSSFDETDAKVASTTVPTKHTLPGLTMEAALNQVASLSLSQLAGKLEMPVDRLSSYTIQELAIKLTMMNLKKDEVKEREPVRSLKTLPMSFESNFADNDDFSTVSAPATVFTSAPPPAPLSQIHKKEEIQTKTETQYDKYAVFRELESEAASGFSICDSQETLPPEEEEIEDGQPSRTLTSRGSSSEKTLQADVDAAGNGLSTMDDITDANFSDGEDEEAKSVLLDEVVDLNLKTEWATFESNFDEQFVPLAATFSKSAESPWDSDADNTMAKFGPTATVTEELHQLQHVQKIKSPKVDPLEQSSQFDFQLFEKPLVSVDPGGRKNSRGNELRGHVISTEPLHFQRQSSGSSKHSERSLRPRPTSSRNITTTSDYSDSGKEKERSHRNPPENWKTEGRRRTDSRNSGSGRRYSREESDEDSARRKWRRQQYYYDDEEDAGSASPVERRRHRRRQDDDECYSNASSRHSHRGSGSSRHGHTGKYYSQSLHRKDREGRLGHSGRRPSESEKYSDHESDFDDSYEDERRRSGRGSGSGYSRSDRDYRMSRPQSGGGSGSGGRHPHHPQRKQRYRDSSREYYHHHHRDRRHSRDRTYHVPYHHSRNVDDEYENEGREISEYSEEEAHRSRRIRGRRRTERDRERPRDHRYYNNSPSWESETPPSCKDDDELDGDAGSEMTRGTRLRKSDLDRPRDRDRRSDRDHERPSSSSYHGDRLDGSCRKASRYQSDLSLNANKPAPKLSVTEFGFEEDNFLPPSHHQQSHTLERHRSNHNQSEPSRPSSHSESNSNKTHPQHNSSNSSNNATAKKISSTVEQNIQQKLPPAESPFEDNFLTENIFFPADFSTAAGTTTNNIVNSSGMEETPKIINSNTVITGTNRNSNSSNQMEPGAGSNSSTGSLDKSDENEELSSPEITGMEERNTNGENRVQNHQQQKENHMIQVVRKPIISDTIHELPDTEMKKSDSFNIFDRDKDPFADDDFFT